ncbi:MAG: flagellar FlbD family protein [Symbiobacteriaceae bacterium]|nr:flagellar FlbD family protein [Symbiobacteriaceae bacterium]
MITVTRLNGTTFILNCELIEVIDATPDTVVTLTSGKRWVLAESPEELVERIISYKKRCFPEIRDLSEK